MNLLIGNKIAMIFVREFYPINWRKVGKFDIGIGLNIILRKVNVYNLKLWR